MSGCKKKNTDSEVSSSTSTTSYTFRITYSGFTNADYSDVTINLHLFKMIEAKLKLGVPSLGTHALNALALKIMYANTGSPFIDFTQWNGLSIQLNEQTSIIARSVMNGYIDTYAAASAFTTITSEGVAGLLATTILSPPKIYCLQSAVSTMHK